MRKRVQKELPHANGDSSYTAPDVMPAAEDHAPETVDPTLLEDRYYSLAATVANTSDIVLSLDQNFHILELNPAAARSLGWASQDACGRRCTEILRCQNLNHIELCGTSGCPLVRVLQQNRPLVNEELLIGSRPDHSAEFSISVTPIEDISGVFRATFIGRDISAMQVAHHVRANFVSMVSHELRTPLNSVHGFVDLLLHGHMGELTEEQSIYLSYVQEGVQQLISIVEDILFMTRSDLGQFEIKPQKTRLRDIVRQVLRTLHPQALKASVELRSEVPADTPFLYADPQRVKQVLNNLVANAIKFTPPGGTVIVSSRAHDGRFQMISVSDTGYGIPSEDCQHVFERFYQANHREQSKMGGYGLGLTIAKLIVEQHEGTISFDTALDKGTMFYFTLPEYHGQDSQTV